MTRARFAWLAALLALAFAFVACGLNPQPLPPGADGSDSAAPADDAGSFGGGEANAPPPAAQDSGTPSADADAGSVDGGDDAGLDGGADADAATDAG